MAEKAKIIDEMHDVTVWRDGERVVVKAHVGWPQDVIDLIGSFDEEIELPARTSSLKDPFE